MNESWEISPDRARELLAAASPAVLIDCRTPQEHAAARISGSVLVPLAELAHRTDEILELVEGASAVIVHCHHGVRSLKAAALLRSIGIASAVSMHGGIDAWSRLIDPTVPRYE